MNLRKPALLFFAFICFISGIAISQKGVSMQAQAANHRIPHDKTAALRVGDFFLTEAELPSPWIPDPTVYTPGAHMRVKEKLMGGEWASVRIRDSALTTSMHVTIGLFPDEAEAIQFANPDTYIFRTDYSMETGQTFTELLQKPYSLYTLSGSTIYGDGGFAGGWQGHKFEPFNVFRVGRVLFHTDASDPANEGILEPLLVNKARKLLNVPEPTDSGLPAVTDSAPQSPTLTPQLPTLPIVLKASLAGKGQATQTLPNTDNYGVIIINGLVTDQEGKGVAGADVTVVSGADAASITTNADGSYSIVVSVPAGLGNGVYQGVNFKLELNDLSIHEVVLLQAIEGGQLVQGRDVGVRVFVVWTGAAPVEVEVVATVDGVAQPPVRGLVKLAYTEKDYNLGTNSINLVLPHTLFPFDTVSTHNILVTAHLVDKQVQEVTLENNISTPKSFTLQRTDSPSLLYVSMHPSIGRAELVKFSGQANHFLEKVYPIPFAWSIVGSARVSHTVVDPNTEFMKTQSVDNLPNWVPDWVKDGVDFPLQGLKSGAYISSIRSVEKARIRYNAQRCRDAANKFILPCNEEIALHAVGVFPNAAYGSDKAGFAYQMFRNSWRAMLNDIGIPFNVSHELGHLYGLSDEYGAGSTGKPVYGSSWDGKAFRTEKGASINFMGQVHLGSPWVDSNTWNTLLGILKVSNITGAHKTAALDTWTPSLTDHPVSDIEAPALIVEGVVTQDGRATLESVTPIYRHEPPTNNQGNFTLRALDEQENVLAETQFDGLFSNQYDGISPIAPFLVVLPVPDPARVALMTISQAGGPILASLERSPSIPTANFDPIPAIGATPVTISWQANDADGDVLLSTLFYSANGGLTWQVLGTDLPVNSLTVDSQELPGGEGRFLLIVNDDMNEVEVVSAPVMVPNHPPVVVIMDVYGTTFESGVPISLHGFSDDIEDGSLPGDNFTWYDEPGNIIGQGYSIQAELPVGQHAINLQVTDSVGQVGSASIDITVQVGSADNEGGNGMVLPAFNLPANTLYLLGGGACLLMLLGGVLAGGALLIISRKRQPHMAGIQGGKNAVQDEHGNWWSQDADTGDWLFWNGKTWQPVAKAAFNFRAPQQVVAGKPRRGISCLLSLLISAVLGGIVIGGISLIGLQFIPGYQIIMGVGDLTEILKMGGGGLLVSVIGFLLLNSGFNAIISRRAFIENERGRRYEKRGCAAILNGVGQVLLGMLLLAGGLGLISLVFYQQVLPWLGF